jgi:predicted permease
MLVGVYGNKKGIITEEFNDNLINFLLNITLPLMVISSFTFSFEESIKSNVVKGFYYSLIAYGILIIASYLFLLPVKGDKKTIIHFANVFTNTGYVGFPVLNAIYGPEGVVYGSIFNMFFVLFVWTYGIMLFKGHIDKMELKKELKTTLLNPSIIAVVIGVIIIVFDIQIPKILYTSINSVGSISGPLSMIIIGAILSKGKIGNSLKDWTLYYGLIVKMAILPLILCLTSLLVDKSIVSNSVVIIASMPAAAMTSIFAESYNKEKELASMFVLLTTLLSVITIPILVRVLI